MKDLLYFLKGILKILIFIAGFLIWFAPMIPMLVWVIFMSIGGQDKSIDEYGWANKWIDFWGDMYRNWRSL